MNFLAEAIRGASKLQSIPGVSRWFPSGADAGGRLDDAALERFRETQALAFRAARTVASELREGWSEYQAASLLTQYLRDSGVSSFFHDSFAWFGERARFDGVRRYRDFMPTQRRLRAGEAFLLDVAPNWNGYRCDIGYSGMLGGGDKTFEAAIEFLRELREAIPTMVEEEKTGGGVCRAVAALFREKNYDAAHEKYPFAVLGHRMYAGPALLPQVRVLVFGLDTFGGFLARGLFGQLLNETYEGTMDGLWAVEPHLGTRTEPRFGAKFEELLLVRDGKARWLSERAPWDDGKKGA